jgi:hypothetical protein
MLFNLMTAIRVRRFRSYEVARACRISESRFSRALHGRSELRAEERQAVAALLGFPECWLFVHEAPVPLAPSQPEEIERASRLAAAHDEPGAVAKPGRQ